MENRSGELPSLLFMHKRKDLQMSKKKRKKKRLPVPPLSIMDYFIYYFFYFVLIIFTAVPIMILGLRGKIFFIGNNVLAVQDDWTLLIPLVPHIIALLTLFISLYSLRSNKYSFIKNKINFNKRKFKKLLIYVIIILLDIGITTLAVFHRTELTTSEINYYNVFNQVTKREDFSNVNEIQVGIIRRGGDGPTYNVSITLLYSTHVSKMFKEYEFQNVFGIEEIVDILTEKGIPKMVKDLEWIENLKDYRNYTEDEWKTVQNLFDML